MIPAVEGQLGGYIVDNFEEVLGSYSGAGLTLLLIASYPYKKRKGLNQSQLGEGLVGEHAVEKFCEGQYDLIFMDMQMPVMDGYAATWKIRKMEEVENRNPTPIIALSTFLLKEEENKSLGAGCDVHLTKPIKKAAFLDTVQKYGEKITGPSR